MTKLTEFDPVKALSDPEVAKISLEEAWKEQDVSGVIEILKMIAKTNGMEKTAKEVGISRSSVYKTLSKNGNPRLETLLGLMGSLGVRAEFHFHQK